jgi:hypothetical protein
MQDSPPSEFTDLEKGGDRNIAAPPEQATLSPSEDQHDLLQKDPNLVSWDGNDDTNNPFNWPVKKKALQVVLMAVNTFIT